MSRRHVGPARPGFTLLELLMVIGIISILIIISVAVAHRVTGTGKAEATKQTLRVLDSALNAYIESKGSPPPPWVVDPRPGNPTNNQYIIPIADAANASDPMTRPINTVGLFILQCREVAEANAAIQGLDNKVLREYDPDGENTAWANQPQLMTAVDGWGNPIRYVHPVFKGIVTDSSGSGPATTANVFPAPPGKQYGIQQIERTASNSDAGLNLTSRPYFYSCGPDGNPATTDDNIYIETPRFQKP